MTAKLNLNTRVCRHTCTPLRQHVYMHTNCAYAHKHWFGFISFCISCGVYPDLPIELSLQYVISEWRPLHIFGRTIIWKFIYNKSRFFSLLCSDSMKRNKNSSLRENFWAAQFCTDFNETWGMYSQRIPLVLLVCRIVIFKFSSALSVAKNS